MTGKTVPQKCCPEHALSVHRNFDSFCLQQLDVVVIGELAALVAVDDLWLP